MFYQAKYPLFPITPFPKMQGPVKQLDEELDRHSKSSQEGDSDTSLNSFISKLSRMAILPSALKVASPSSGNHKNETPTNNKTTETKKGATPESSVQKMPARGRSLNSEVPQREDSESPETDPDFRISSSSSSQGTDTSWIPGTGMISEAMVGSMLSGDGYDQSSSNEYVYENTIEKTEGEERDKKSSVAEVSQVEKDKTNERGDESDYSIGEFDVHTNRISAEQAKVAAALTMVILAAFWAWESRDSGTSRV